MKEAGWDKKLLSEKILSLDTIRTINNNFKINNDLHLKMKLIVICIIWNYIVDTTMRNNKQIKIKAKFGSGFLSFFIYFL